MANLWTWERLSFCLKGLYTENFYCLKRCPLPPWSMCHMWKIWQLAIKNRKIYFLSEFWALKMLTGRENGSQNCLPDGNLALKIAYRTGIWLSKSLTGREFGSQRHYRTGIWLSKSLTGRESGHDMTKMHFSIFYRKLSDFSHMTHWSGGQGVSFKQIKIFGVQSL